MVPIDRRVLVCYNRFNKWKNYKQLGEQIMKTVNQIQEQFKAPRGCGYAVAYHVPMEMLEEVRLAYRNEGIKIRVRYRGPRVKNRYGVAYHTLKNNATSFSVYKQ
jgi:hypothetical protein